MRFIDAIQHEATYHAAIERIEALWDVEPGTAEADELDVLAT